MGVHTKERPPALRRHKRPKSKLQEAPMLRGGHYPNPSKTIAISGSIVRKGSRTDTKVCVSDTSREMPRITASDKIAFKWERCGLKAFGRHRCG